MMDCLRFEWSPRIAETIISFADCLNEYKTSATPTTPREIIQESSSNVTVNVALSHINMFLIINDKMCVMTRIDAVTLEKTNVKSGAVVSGLKMTEMVPYTGNKLLYKIGS